MIVDLKCPAWKGLAILGEEKSKRIFFPSPERFVPKPPVLNKTRDGSGFSNFGEVELSLRERVSNDGNGVSGNSGSK